MASFRHFINSHLPSFWKRFLVVYVTFILATPFIPGAHSCMEILRGIFAAFFLSIVLCPLISKQIQKIPPIQPAVSNYSPIETVFLFLIPFLFFLSLFIIYYPGGFSPDSISQYEQTLTHQYNNWHPVLATLISFRLPLLLSNGWLGSVILFQILLFSGVIGYCCYSVRQYTNRKITYILLVFFLLNPQTGNMAMFAWKDSLFAIAVLLLTTFALHIYFTDGKWLQNGKTGLLILLLALTSLLRHNAILFTFPFIVALAGYVSRQKAVTVFTVTCALIICIKGCLFPLMHVELPSQRKGEMLGLPMSVIGAVTAQNPASLDDETKEFVYQIAPAQTWETHFRNGYNNIKFLPETRPQIIDEHGAKKVLRMTARCFAREPLLSLKALVTATYPVYSILDHSALYPFPSIAENPYGISANSGKLPTVARKTRFVLARFLDICFPYFFIYVGFMHLLLVLAWTTCPTLSSCRKILFTLPVFCYNFGTALLLCGPNDCWRFFFYTFLVTPVLLILFFTRKESDPVNS